MSLAGLYRSASARRGNLLRPRHPQSCRRSAWKCRQPILTNRTLAEGLRCTDLRTTATARVPTSRRSTSAGRGRRGAAMALRTALDDLCDSGRRDRPSRRRHRSWSDSDRQFGNEAGGADPVPCWRRGRCTTTSSASRPARTSGLVLESGETREVHHFAVLVGYGRGRGQPVPRLRDAIRRRCDAQGRCRRTRSSGDRGAIRRSQATVKGVDKGDAQGHVQDGDLDAPVLQAARRSSRRWASAPELIAASASPRTPTTNRGHRARPPSRGGGDRRAARSSRHLEAYGDGDGSCIRDLMGRRGPTHWRRGGREPRLEPRRSYSNLQHAARTKRDDGAEILPRVHRAREPAGPKRLQRCGGCSGLRADGAADARRPLDEVEPAERDRQAVLHRRDELRLDLRTRRTKRSRSP